MAVVSGPWRKSSISNPSGSCVELAPLADGGVAMRHSKNREVTLEFTAAEWKAFMKGAELGEFDSL